MCPGGRVPRWPVTAPWATWRMQRLPRQWLQPPAPAGTSHPSHDGPLHKVRRVPEHTQARGLTVTGTCLEEAQPPSRVQAPTKCLGTSARAPSSVTCDVLGNPQTPALVPASPPAAASAHADRPLTRRRVWAPFRPSLSLPGCRVSETLRWPEFSVVHHAHFFFLAFLVTSHWSDPFFPSDCLI